MKSLYPLFGIVTVLNTPFTRDDRIDGKSLRKNVKRALEAGVSGFLLPAMASEVYKLSHEERLEMVSTVLEEVNDKVPVIAGAGEKDLAKSRKILKAYMELGCKRVLFQIPFISHLQFHDQFMTLAELGPELIMLQDWDPDGYGLPDDLICELFEKVEAFRCLKIETVPAGMKYSRILERTGGRLNLSGGWAVSQMLEGLARGIHAFMPTGMHYLYTKIFRDYKDGNYAEAENLFYELLPVLAFSNQHLDISIHFFKRLLHQHGIYATANVRQPILDFDGIHAAISDKLIQRIIRLEDLVQSGRGIGAVL